MFCVRCKQIPKGAEPSGSGAGPQTLPGWERLKIIMCSRCGELLPAKESTDRLLDTLSELARFGLSAGTSTILEP
jgi:hypothetical protein